MGIESQWGARFPTPIETSLGAYLLLLQWRYSPGWALASITIRLQASRSLALSLHSFIPIFPRSVDTSSNHLIFGLPLRLVAYSFPYNIISFLHHFPWLQHSLNVPCAKYQVRDSSPLPQSGIHYVPRLIVGFRNN